VIGLTSIVRCLTRLARLDRSNLMKALRNTVLVVMAMSALTLTSARADQPHMQRALQHLRAARAELERAEHNKGGWRSRAIHNVDQAIADTENGIKTAR